MISTPDFFRAALALAFAASLAACGGGERPLPPLDAARAALAKGDGVGAEIILREMLDQGTPRAELAAYMGEAEIKQGRLPEAHDWLDGGGFSPDSRGHGFHMLGLLEMTEGDLPAAGKAFDKALRTSANDADLWVDIGRLRYLGGELTLAAQASQKALALGPENASALSFHGQLVRESQGNAAALPFFEHALRSDPNNIDLLADYAATLGELGHVKDMLNVVRQMAELDRSDGRIYLFQAVIAARAGNFDLAQTIFSRIDSLADDIPAAGLLDGTIDLENGNFASAAQRFDRLLRVQPDNRRVRMLLARALHLAGNDRELVYRFGDEAAGEGASPYLAELVGRAYEALGERAKAAPYLERAAQPVGLQLVPMASTTPLDVARAQGTPSGLDTQAIVRGLIARHRAGEAVSAAEAFRARFPGSGDALSLAGDAQVAAGHIDAGLARYRAAAALRRSWPLTRRMVAAYSAKGDRNSAAALLAAQLESEPANREAATLLATLAFDAGHVQNGDILVEHAIQAGGTNDPQLWALRGVADVRQGDAPAAVAGAREAFALQPANPTVRAVLANALAADGDAVAASAAKRP